MHAGTKQGSATQLADGQTVHPGVQCDMCGTHPIIGVRCRSVSRENYDLCDACADSSAGAEAGPFERSGCSAAQAALLCQSSRGGQGPVQNKEQYVHVPLVQWVWHYFTGAHARSKHMYQGGDPPPANGKRPPPRVVATGLPPLYFQVGVTITQLS